MEDWTLNNLETLIVFPKEVGVINTVKQNLFQTFHHIKRYEESSKWARQFIDSLDTEKLTDKGYRILSLSYYYLLKNYEALGNNEKTKEVCEEAIEKLPKTKDTETFIKKLKELNSAPR